MMLLFSQNRSLKSSVFRAVGVGLVFVLWWGAHQVAYGQTQPALSQCELNDDFAGLELSGEDTQTRTAEIRVKRGDTVSKPLTVKLAAEREGPFAFALSDEFPDECLSNSIALPEFANDPGNIQPLSYSVPGQEIPLWALRGLANAYEADVAVFQMSGAPHVCGGGYVVIAAKTSEEKQDLTYEHDLVQAVLTQDPNARLDVYMPYDEEDVPFLSQSHEKFLDKLNENRDHENKQDEFWIASPTAKFKVHVGVEKSGFYSPGVWKHACSDWKDAPDIDETAGGNGDEIVDLEALKRELASLTLAQVNDPDWIKRELEALKQRLRILLFTLHPDTFLSDLQSIMNPEVWLVLKLDEAFATSEDPDGRAIKVLDSFEVLDSFDDGILFGKWLYRDGIGTEPADTLRDGFLIDGIRSPVTAKGHESPTAFIHKPRREGSAMGAYQIAIAEHTFGADIDVADWAYVSYSIKSLKSAPELTAEILLVMFDPSTGDTFYAPQRDATKKTYADVYQNWETIRVPLDTYGYRGLRAHAGLKIRGYQIVLGRTDANYLWDDDDTPPELHLDNVQLLGCIESDADGKGDDDVANCSPKPTPKGHPDGDQVAVRFDFDVPLTEMKRLTPVGIGVNHADEDIQGPGRDSEFSLRIETKGRFNRGDNTGREFRFTPEDWTPYSSLKYFVHTPHPDDESDPFRTIGVAIQFQRDGQTVTLWQEAALRQAMDKTTADWTEVTVPLSAESFPATKNTSTTEANDALDPSIDLRQVVGVWFFVDRNGKDSKQRTILIDDVALRCSDQDGKCAAPVQSGGIESIAKFSCPRDVKTDPFATMFPGEDGAKTFVVCDYVTNERQVRNCPPVETRFGEVPNLTCPLVTRQITSFVKITIPPLVFTNLSAVVNVTFENSSPKRQGYEPVSYRVKYLGAVDLLSVKPQEFTTIAVKPFEVEDSYSVPESVRYENELFIESLGRHEQHPDEDGKAWKLPFVIDIKGGGTGDSSEQAKRRVAQWDFNDRPALIKEQDGFSTDRHDKDPGASLTGIFAGPANRFEQHFAPDDDFMVTFWVYPPTGDDVPEDHEGAIIGNRLDAGAGWELRLTRYLQPSLVLQGADGAQQTYSFAHAPTTAEPLGAWHQVTLIWNDKTPTILLDGDVLRDEGGNELKLEPSGEPQNFASSSRLVVGGGAASTKDAYVDEYWGSIDDVIVFRGAFTPIDVKKLYDEHKHDPGFDVLQFLSGLFLLDVFPDAFPAPDSVSFFGGFDIDPAKEAEQWAAWPGEVQADVLGVSKAISAVTRPEGFESHVLRYTHNHFEEIDENTVAALVRKKWGQSESLSDYGKISFDAVAIQGSGAYVALQLRKPNADTWTSKAFAMRGKQGDQNQIVVDISAAGDEFLGNLGSFPIAFVFAQPAAESTKIHGKVAFAIDNVTGHVAGTGPELTTPDADLNELGNTVVPALALGNTNILADDVLMNAFDRDVDGHSVTSLWTAYGGQVGSTAISIAEDSEWTAALRFEEDDIAKFAGLRYPPTSGKAGVDFQPLNLSAYSNVSFTAQAPGGTLAIVFVDGDGEHWRSDKTAGTTRETVLLELEEQNGSGFKLSTAAEDSEQNGNKTFDKGKIKEIRFHYTSNVSTPKLVKFYVDDVKFTPKPGSGDTNLAGLGPLEKCERRDGIVWGISDQGDMVLSNPPGTWSATFPTRSNSDYLASGSLSLDARPEGCLDGLQDESSFVWVNEFCEGRPDEDGCKAGQNKGIPPWVARSLANSIDSEIAVFKTSTKDACFTAAEVNEGEGRLGYVVLTTEDWSQIDSSSSDIQRFFKSEPHAELLYHIHVHEPVAKNSSEDSTDIQFGCGTDTTNIAGDIPLPSRADYNFLKWLNQRNGQTTAEIATSCSDHVYTYGLEGTEYYHPTDWAEACVDWVETLVPDKWVFRPAKTPYTWSDISTKGGIKLEARIDSSGVTQKTYQLKGLWSLLAPESKDGTVSISASNITTISLVANEELIKLIREDQAIEVLELTDPSTGKLVAQLQVTLDLANMPEDEDTFVFFGDFEDIPRCGEDCSDWGIAVHAAARAPDADIDAKLITTGPRQIVEKTQDVVTGTDGKLVYTHPKQPEWSAIYKPFEHDLSPYLFEPDPNSESTNSESKGGMSVEVVAPDTGLGQNAGCMRISFIEEDGDTWTSKDGYAIPGGESRRITFPLLGNATIRDWFTFEGSVIGEPDPETGFIPPNEQTGNEPHWAKIKQISFVFAPIGEPLTTPMAVHIDSLTGYRQAKDEHNQPIRDLSQFTPSDPAVCAPIERSAEELLASQIAGSRVNPFYVELPRKIQTANKQNVETLLVKSEYFPDAFGFQVTQNEIARAIFSKEGAEESHWHFGLSHDRKEIFIVPREDASPIERLVAGIIHHVTHFKLHKEGFYGFPAYCHNGGARTCGSDLHGFISRAEQSLFREFHPEPREFGDTPMSERQWREFQYNLWMDAETEAVFNSMVVLAGIADRTGGLYGADYKLSDWMLLGPFNDRANACGEKKTEDGKKACALSELAQDNFEEFWKLKEPKDKNKKCYQLKAQQNPKQDDIAWCDAKELALQTIKQLVQYRLDYGYDDSEGKPGLQMLRQFYNETLQRKWGADGDEFGTVLYFRDSARGTGASQHYSSRALTREESEQFEEELNKRLFETTDNAEERAKQVSELLQTAPHGRDQDAIWYQHVRPKGYCSNPDEDGKCPEMKPPINKDRRQYNGFFPELNDYGDFESCGSAASPKPCRPDEPDEPDEVVDGTTPVIPDPDAESVLAVIHGAGGTVRNILNDKAEVVGGELLIQAGACGVFQVTNTGTATLEGWEYTLTANEGENIIVNPANTKLGPGEGGVVSICALDAAQTDRKTLGQIEFRDSAAGPALAPVYNIVSVVSAPPLPLQVPFSSSPESWSIEVDSVNDADPVDEARVTQACEEIKTGLHHCSFKFRNEERDKIAKVSFSLPVPADKLGSGDVWLRWSPPPTNDGKLYIELLDSTTGDTRLLRPILGGGADWTRLFSASLYLSGVNRHFDTVSFVAIQNETSRLPERPVGDWHSKFGFDISFSRPQRAITWSGHDWDVQHGAPQVAESKTAEDVAIGAHITDEDVKRYADTSGNVDLLLGGALRLAMTEKTVDGLLEDGRPSNKQFWHGASLKSQKPADYGTYRIVVEDGFDQLGASLLAGMFLYSETDQALHEIDIEFTRYLDDKGENHSVFTSVHDLGGDENKVNTEGFVFPSASLGSKSTHCLRWTEKRVDFASYEDEVDCFDPDLTPVEGSDRSVKVGVPPRTGNEHVYLNLWKVKGEPLSHDEHRRITFLDYSFTPIEKKQPPKPMPEPPKVQVPDAFDGYVAWNDQRWSKGGAVGVNSQDDIALYSLVTGSSSPEASPENPDDTIADKNNPDRKINVVITPILPIVQVAKAGDDAQIRFDFENSGGMDASYSIGDTSIEVPRERWWTAGTATYDHVIDTQSLVPGVYWQKITFANDQSGQKIHRLIQVEVGGTTLFDGKEFSSLWRPEEEEEEEGWQWPSWWEEEGNQTAWRLVTDGVDGFVHSNDTELQFGSGVCAIYQPTKQKCGKRESIFSLQTVGEGDFSQYGQIAVTVRGLHEDGRVLGTNDRVFVSVVSANHPEQTFTSEAKAPVVLGAHTTVVFPIFTFRGHPGAAPDWSQIIQINVGVDVGDLVLRDETVKYALDHMSLLPKVDGADDCAVQEFTERDDLISWGISPPTNIDFNITEEEQFDVDLLLRGGDGGMVVRRPYGEIDFVNNRRDAVTVYQAVGAGCDMSGISFEIRKRNEMLSRFQPKGQKAESASGVVQVQLQTGPLADGKPKSWALKQVIPVTSEQPRKVNLKAADDFFPYGHGNTDDIAPYISAIRRIAIVYLPLEQGQVSFELESLAYGPVSNSSLKPAIDVGFAPGAWEAALQSGTLSGDVFQSEKFARWIWDRNQGEGGDTPTEFAVNWDGSMGPGDPEVDFSHQFQSVDDVVLELVDVKLADTDTELPVNLEIIADLTGLLGRTGDTELYLVTADEDRAKQTIAWDGKSPVEIDWTRIAPEVLQDSHDQGINFFSSNVTMLTEDGNIIAAGKLGFGLKTDYSKFPVKWGANGPVATVGPTASDGGYFVFSSPEELYVTLDPIRSSQAMDITFTAKLTGLLDDGAVENPVTEHTQTITLEAGGEVTPKIAWDLQKVRAEQAAEGYRVFSVYVGFRVGDAIFGGKNTIIIEPGTADPNVQDWEGMVAALYADHTPYASADTGEPADLSSMKPATQDVFRMALWMWSQQPGFLQGLPRIGNTAQLVNIAFGGAINPLNQTPTLQAKLVGEWDDIYRKGAQATPSDPDKRKGCEHELACAFKRPDLVLSGGYKPDWSSVTILPFGEVPTSNSLDGVMPALEMRVPQGGQQNAKFRFENHGYLTATYKVFIGDQQIDTVTVPGRTGNEKDGFVSGKVTYGYPYQAGNNAGEDLVMLSFQNQSTDGLDGPIKPPLPKILRPIRVTICADANDCVPIPQAFPDVSKQSEDWWTWFNPHAWLVAGGIIQIAEAEEDDEDALDPELQLDPAKDDGSCWMGAEQHKKRMTGVKLELFGNGKKCPPQGAVNFTLYPLPHVGDDGRYIVKPNRYQCLFRWENKIVRNQTDWSDSPGPYAVFVRNMPLKTRDGEDVVIQPNGDDSGEVCGVIPDFTEAAFPQFGLKNGPQEGVKVIVNVENVETDWQSKHFYWHELEDCGIVGEKCSCAEWRRTSEAQFEERFAKVDMLGSNTQVRGERLKVFEFDADRTMEEIAAMSKIERRAWLFGTYSGSLMCSSEDSELKEEYGDGRVPDHALWFAQGTWQFRPIDNGTLYPTIEVYGYWKDNPLAPFALAQVDFLVKAKYDLERVDLIYYDWGLAEWKRFGTANGDLENFELSLWMDSMVRNNKDIVQIINGDATYNEVALQEFLAEFLLANDIYASDPALWPSLPAGKVFTHPEINLLRVPYEEPQKQKVVLPHADGAAGPLISILISGSASGVTLAETTSIGVVAAGHAAGTLNKEARGKIFDKAITPMSTTQSVLVSKYHIENAEKLEAVRQMTAKDLAWNTFHGKIGRSVFSSTISKDVSLWVQSNKHIDITWEGYDAYVNVYFAGRSEDQEDIDNGLAAPPIYAELVAKDPSFSKKPVIEQYAGIMNELNKRNSGGPGGPGDPDDFGGDDQNIDNSTPYGATSAFIRERYEDEDWYTDLSQEQQDAMIFAITWNVIMATESPMLPIGKVGWCGYVCALGGGFPTRITVSTPEGDVKVGYSQKSPPAKDVFTPKVTDPVTGIVSDSPINYEFVSGSKKAKQWFLNHQGKDWLTTPHGEVFLERIKSPVIPTGLSHVYIGNTPFELVKTEESQNAINWLSDKVVAPTPHGMAFLKEADGQTLPAEIDLIPYKNRNGVVKDYVFVQGSKAAEDFVKSFAQDKRIPLPTSSGQLIHLEPTNAPVYDITIDDTNYIFTGDQAAIDSFFHPELSGKFLFWKNPKSGGLVLLRDSAERPEGTEWLDQFTITLQSTKLDAFGNPADIATLSQKIKDAGLDKGVWDGKLVDNKEVGKIQSYADMLSDFGAGGRATTLGLGQKSIGTHSIGPAILTQVHAKTGKRMVEIYVKDKKWFVAHDEIGIKKYIADNNLDIEDYTTTWISNQGETRGVDISPELASIIPHDQPGVRVAQFASADTVSELDGYAITPDGVYHEGYTEFLFPKTLEALFPKSKLRPVSTIPTTPEFNERLQVVSERWNASMDEQLSRLGIDIDSTGGAPMTALAYQVLDVMEASLEAVADGPTTEIKKAIGRAKGEIKYIDKSIAHREQLMIELLRAEIALNEYRRNEETDPDTLVQLDENIDQAEIALEHAIQLTAISKQMVEEIKSTCPDFSQLDKQLDAIIPGKRSADSNDIVASAAALFSIPSVYAQTQGGDDDATEGGWEPIPGDELIEVFIPVAFEALFGDVEIPEAFADDGTDTSADTPAKLFLRNNLMQQTFDDVASSEKNIEEGSPLEKLLQDNSFLKLGWIRAQAQAVVEDPANIPTLVTRVLVEIGNHYTNDPRFEKQANGEFTVIGAQRMIDKLVTDGHANLLSSWLAQNHNRHFPSDPRQALNEIAEAIPDPRLEEPFVSELLRVVKTQKFEQHLNIELLGSQAQSGLIPENLDSNVASSADNALFAVNLMDYAENPGVSSADSQSAEWGMTAILEFYQNDYQAQIAQGEFAGFAMTYTIDGKSNSTPGIAANAMIFDLLATYRSRTGNAKYQDMENAVLTWLLGQQRDNGGFWQASYPSYKTSDQLLVHSVLSARFDQYGSVKQAEMETALDHLEKFLNDVLWDHNLKQYVEGLDDKTGLDKRVSFATVAAEYLNIDLDHVAPEFYEHMEDIFLQYTKNTRSWLTDPDGPVDPDNDPPVKEDVLRGVSEYPNRKPLPLVGGLFQNSPVSIPATAQAVLVFETLSQKFIAKSKNSFAQGKDSQAKVEEGWAMLYNNLANHHRSVVTGAYTYTIGPLLSDQAPAEGTEALDLFDLNTVTWSTRAMSTLNVDKHVPYDLNVPDKTGGILELPAEPLHVLAVIPTYNEADKGLADTLVEMEKTGILHNAVIVLDGPDDIDPKRVIKAGTQVGENEWLEKDKPFEKIPGLFSVGDRKAYREYQEWKAGDQSKPYRGKKIDLYEKGKNDNGFNPYKRAIAVEFSRTKKMVLDFQARRASEGKAMYVVALDNFGKEQGVLEALYNWDEEGFASLGDQLKKWKRGVKPDLSNIYLFYTDADTTLIPVNPFMSWLEAANARAARMKAKGTGIIAGNIVVRLQGDLGLKELVWKSFVPFQRFGKGNTWVQVADSALFPLVMSFRKWAVNQWILPLTVKRLTSTNPLHANNLIVGFHTMANL